LKDAVFNLELVLPERADGRENRAAAAHWVANSFIRAFGRGLLGPIAGIQGQVEEMNDFRVCELQFDDTPVSLPYKIEGAFSGEQTGLPVEKSHLPMIFTLFVMWMTSGYHWLVSATYVPDFR
jgi:hypothetical protein